ncbi:MAG TPA: NAD(P)H-hydrate dehydratase [Longimicrobiales bacterium]
MSGDLPASHLEPGVYGRVHVPLPTAEQAAAADRRARESYDIPERVLMESAGRAAALVLDRLFPRGRVAGVAGSGHNGGDLLVLLRVLRAWGRDVTLIAAGSKAPDAALRHGDELRIVPAVDGVAALGRADVIVDGLLGTGAQGAPRGSIAEWIRRVGDAERPVLSLDLPSGVDATTGTAADIAIHAAATVTFGWPKLGLLLHPARAHCGRLIAVEMGFPEACAEAGARLITSAWVRAHLRPRAPAAHKGTAGRLLVLAGSDGMAGAAALAGRAAIRTGAGLVRLASPAANRVILQTLLPEATFLERDAVTSDALEPMHAIVAGPGLGTDAMARAALEHVLELTAGRPALLDADALNLFAEDPAGLRAAASTRPLVITPHVRELARVLDTPLESILADAPAAARRAARDFGCVVLLKGQPSLIAQPDGELFVNSVGSSDVATAGMGDQLCGTIGALLAAAYDPAIAAALGLYLSGRAADLAQRGPSLMPSDVNDHLAHAMSDPGPASSPLGLPFITFDQPARR